VNSAIRSRIDEVMDRHPSEVVMRAFGGAMDLDLDFAGPDRQGLVTALLAQCSEPGDAAFWWRQPVSARTAGLFRVVALTERCEQIPLVRRCPAASCGETFEVELPIGTIARAGATTGTLTVRLAGDRVVAMRLPTGDDLRRWREARPHSQAAALRLMLDSLVLDGEIGPDDEAAVQDRIADSDPLVDFSVSCRCPACGVPSEMHVDLEALALVRLFTRQRALLHEVHRFATHYGWSEADVLAVPAARRARYLALIEDGR
jgi:hypothetical protein